MNIIERIKNENFLKLDQFAKRKEVKHCMLKTNDCKIGLKVLCFEDGTLIDDKYRSYFKFKGFSPSTKVHLTIGKTYTILDKKENKIKLQGDNNLINWFSITRFVCTLRLERKEKLKKIKKMSDGITDSRRGFSSISNWEREQEIYNKNMQDYYEFTLEKIPLAVIEKFVRKKKLQNIEID